MFFILILRVFVIILHVSCLFFTNSNDYNLLLGSAVFRVHIDIDKDADCLQSNNNDPLNDLWLLFATLSFSLNSCHFHCFCAALFTQAY